MANSKYVIILYLTTICTLTNHSESEINKINMNSDCNPKIDEITHSFYNSNEEAIPMGEDNDMVVKIEDRRTKVHIYGVNDSPPIHITIISGLQQALLVLAGQLVVSLLVAEAMCASNNDVFKAKLLSSTLFMTGVSTIAMSVIGIRLPIFQGAAAKYVIPLLIIANDESSFCSTMTVQEPQPGSMLNISMNASVADDVSMERILHNVKTFQGSLMIAGLLHALVGFSGLIGLLMNLIGPITIVPCMVLVGVFLARISIAFAQVHWGIALSTAGVGVILSLYLGNHNMPVPVWTPKMGFRIIRYPLHQVFAILISILLNWLLCGILTYAGVFKNDPTNVEYRSRTDARLDVIIDSPWLNFPYPGQYGMPGFSEATFISCFIATILSILDSISDYYACARVCRVPAPPSHAVNRGILIEGICSFLSGTVGCGHATTTSGGNIGAIGITKVASRQVFVVAGIIYILFGILGKFSAIFITIPYPVLGGAIILMWGTFFGVILSNLQVLNMSSSRNMAIVGISIMVGIMIPTYIKETKNPINTGNEAFDRITTMILGMPNLAGSIIACFLDNTVPGSRKDRGIEAWQVSKGTEDSIILDTDLYDEGYEVYLPLLPKRLLRHRLMKYVPFMPYIKTFKECSNKNI